MIVRGHRITAIVMNVSAADGEEPGDLEALGVSVQVVDRPKWKAFLSCVRALPSRLPLQAAYCQSGPQADIVAHQLAIADVDVLHVEHLRAAQYGMRINAVPRVYDGVDCMSLLWARTERSGMLSRRLLAKFELPRLREYEARVLRDFDRVLASSQTDANAMQALAPTVTPMVVSNGVDSSYFETVPWTPERESLVFSGRMSYHANEQAVVDFARRVLPRIKVRHPAVRLTILGSSPTRAVHALAKDPAISVTGYVPDLRPFFGRASVALCPVYVGAGTQFKVLEAMAAGVPLVTSSMAARPLGLRHEEHVLVADGPEANAEAVCRLLEDRALASRLHSFAQAFVRRHFDWTVAGDRLESIYKEAISEGARVQRGPRQSSRPSSPQTY